MGMLRRISAVLVLTITLASPLFAQSTLDIVANGTAYGRAQVTAWLDEDRFAVTRLDGTIAIFRPPTTTESSPVITEVLLLPSAKAAEMALPLSPEAFVTSNDTNSLAIWVEKDSHHTVMETPKYDAHYGIANSATLVDRGGRQWLVTGHAEGYVLIWSLAGAHLSLIQAVSVRSPLPIPSPYELRNVRSVVRWKEGTVIAGAEDGDITMINIPDGSIQARVRYSSSAQRGINSLSISGDYLLLANCSVGVDDKNLWLYRLEPAKISLLDSMNLILDSKQSQVFNFTALFAQFQDGIVYFASTQEGLLWMGKVANDKLTAIPRVKIACDGGAALAFQPKRALLSIAAFDVSIYSLEKR